MEYNKILVEIHHGLGDVVQMIPLIKNLRKNYSNAKISVIVASKVHAEILECTDLVDNYYFLNLKRMRKRDVIAFVRKIRAEKYDIGFLSPISNKKIGPILLQVLGCKYKVIEMPQKRKLYMRNTMIVKEDRTIHQIDRNLNLLKVANIKIYDSNPFMKIDDEKRNLAKEKIGYRNSKLIGICIGTNPVEERIGSKRIYHDVKKWPIENYLRLINNLGKEYKIILLGGKKEEDEIKEFTDAIEKNSSVINLINTTTVMESASLINECDLVIGGDTGMLHIADALGKNTLTIFGPTDPDLVGPYSKKSNNITLGIDCQYCYGTEQVFECNNGRCLSGITVENIYNKAIEIINA